MSVTVEVRLLSGKTASVNAGLDEQVELLKRRAQIALQVGKGRLVDSSGAVLDARVSIEAACVKDGDSLTFHISKAQVFATRRGFIALLGDGSVVAWGRVAWDSVVQDQLQNVQQIQSCGNELAPGFCGSAFAAILGDGSVMTWGPADYGGDSRAVQEQLKNVQQIQSSPGYFEGAFAAIRGDGSVVTWGSARGGGDSSAVQHQLKNVQQIQASRSAFAALLGDGSVVTWGIQRYGGDSGGDSRAVQDRLKNVQQSPSHGGCFCCYPRRRIGRDLGYG